MRESFTKAKRKGSVVSSLNLAHYTRVIFKMVNLMVKEFFDGLQEKFIPATGKMERKQGMGCGRE
jgi:hypothetical protein